MSRKRDATDITVPGLEGDVRIRRYEHGYPHIQADAEIDRLYGLGYAHARDRQMQMNLLRIVGQGRLSECLRGERPLIEVDRHMRWLNLGGEALAEAKTMSSELTTTLDAYCRGVNEGSAATGRPFEFKLTRYHPEPWIPADSLLIAKVMGFIGLTQAQGEAEKFIVELVQAGVDEERIRALFPEITDDLSPEYLALLRQVKLHRQTIDPTVLWDVLPSFSASNNWAVGPERSASGHALLCGDPHLAMQLPVIWYPVVMTDGRDFLAGATVAGLPAIAIGRSREMAWSATYGTSDVSDFFIEEVKGGKYRRGTEWLDFTVREEEIKPRGKAPVTIRIHETDHGPLEGTPDSDGYYLSCAWASRKKTGTAAESLEQFSNIHRATDVHEGIEAFAGLTFASFNWVFADRKGNIGYQLGGTVPQRPEGASGLVPLPGWEANWDGFVDPHHLPRSLNPDCGLIVTANNDLNHLGQMAPMTLPMSSYRADRVAELIDRPSPLTPDDMKAIQHDRRSLQADLFLPLIEPHLPDNEIGQALRTWNGVYECDSVAAAAFERIYAELLLTVFGDGGVGRSVITHLIEHTSLYNTLHRNLDRILLDETSPWFRDKSGHDLYARAVECGLSQPIPVHGEDAKTTLYNIFWAGKLPRWLGIDVDIEHLGSRATVSQSQKFGLAGRTSSVGAGLRIVADLGNDILHLATAGGASDRRTSPYYTKGLDAWLEGRYLELSPEPPPS